MDMGIFKSTNLGTHCSEKMTKYRTRKGEHKGKKENEKMGKYRRRK
jgi:hypothetical protein